MIYYSSARVRLREKGSGAGMNLMTNTRGVIFAGRWTGAASLEREESLKESLEELVMEFLDEREGWSSGEVKRTEEDGCFLVGVDVRVVVLDRWGILGVEFNLLFYQDTLTNKTPQMLVDRWRGIGNDIIHRR